jgi:GGDEF domain-containing protein
VKNLLAVTAAPEQHAMLEQKRGDFFKLILQTTLVASLLFGGVNLLLNPAKTHTLAIALPVLFFSLTVLILLKASRIYCVLVVPVSPSVGISIYPEDGTNPDDLMHNADHAMYAAKAQHPQLVQI